MNGLANPLIGSATADVAAESFINVGIGWRWIFCQQRRRCHDHAHLAVAALRHLRVQPRNLHGMLAVR